MERIPLKHIQKEEVYRLWLEDHIEEDYHRKNNLLVFCKENNCDIILAIECIIENIRGRVLIKYKSRGRDTFEYFKEDNDYYQLNSKLCDIVGNREDCYESEAVYYIFKNNNGEYKRDNTVNTCIESVSKKAVEDDVVFLTKWKEEILADEGKLLGSISNNIIDNNNNFITPIDTNLSATQASKIFERLIEEGFIDKDSDKNSFLYFLGAIKPLDKQETIKWTATKSLCAYFAEKFNEEIMEGERNILKPFENIFSTNRLANTINDYHKKGTTPKGSDTIDEILKEIRGL